MNNLYVYHVDPLRVGPLCTLFVVGGDWEDQRENALLFIMNDPGMYLY